MLYFAYQTRWVALVTVLLAGYLAHFACKAFQLMGEFGYIAPFFAGWLAPLLLIVAVVPDAARDPEKARPGRRAGDTPHFADELQPYAEPDASVLDKMLVDRLAAGDVGAENIQ